MIVAATGHRPDKCGGYGTEAHSRIIDIAIRYLRETKPDFVITGMALGWDTAVAEAALFSGVPYIAAVPFAGQESRWPERSQEVHRNLLAFAAQVFVISNGGFTARAMQKRNEWMVDRADRMLALWDGNIGGGTCNCIAYAEKKGVPIDNMWDRL